MANVTVFFLVEFIILSWMKIRQAKAFGEIWQMNLLTPFAETSICLIQCKLITDFMTLKNFDRYPQKNEDYSSDHSGRQLYYACKQYKK